MTFLNKTLLLAGVTSLLATPLFADSDGGDAEAGEKVFKKCKACHQVGAEAKNRNGPLLNDIIGRVAGTTEGYKYSKSMIAAGEAGLVWDQALMAEYLEDPKTFLREFLDDSKAKSKMTFKLKKEDERMNVAAYVATFSAPAEMSEGEEPSEDMSEEPTE